MNRYPDSCLAAIHCDIVLLAVFSRHRCNLVDGQAEIACTLTAKFQEFQAERDCRGIGTSFKLLNDATDRCASQLCENSGRGSLARKALTAHGHRDIELGGDIVLK